jgi:hypothetical protein
VIGANIGRFRGASLNRRRNHRLQQDPGDDGPCFTKTLNTRPDP